MQSLELAEQVRDAADALFVRREEADATLERDVTYGPFSITPTTAAANGTTFSASWSGGRIMFARHGRRVQMTLANFLYAGATLNATADAVVASPVLLATLPTWLRPTADVTFTQVRPSSSGGRFRGIFTLGTNGDLRLTGLASTLTAGATFDAGATYMVDEVAPALDWKNAPAGVGVHRTGGATPWAVPGSFTATDQLLAAGVNFFDLDLRYTSDGVLTVFHDGTLDATTNGTGEVKSLPWSTVSGLSILASKTTGGTYADEPMRRIEDWLDRYGHRVLLTIEPKNQTLLSEWQRSIELLAPIIHARGLEKSVTVFCSGSVLATHAPIIKRAGLRCGIYLNAAQSNDRSLNLAAKRMGIDMVLVSPLTNDLSARRWASVVPQVMWSGSWRRPAADATFAKGTRLLLDDWGVYAGRLNPRIAVDPWRSGRWGFGDVSPSEQARPRLVSDGLIFDTIGTSVLYQSLLAGDFAPLPSTYTLELDATTIGTLPASAWFGVQVGGTSDNGWYSAAGTTGLYCIASATGNVSIGRSVNGAGTTVATGTTTALPTAGNFRLRVVATATDTTVTRRDPTNGTQIGNAATYTNSELRGGYLQLALFSSDPLAGSGVKVRSLTIT